MNVCIDPGHGGHDPGAVFQDWVEKDICLVVGLWLRDHLCDRGHDVLVTRPDDQYVGISARARKANAVKADIFVSLHMNADPDEDLPGMREARGGEIWIYPGSKRGRLLAESIGKHLVAKFPDEPWRGIKEEEFGVLAMTHMPAVLVEMAFIDCSATTRSMTEARTRHQMVDALAEGIHEYAQVNV